MVMAAERTTDVADRTRIRDAPTTRRAAAFRHSATSTRCNRVRKVGGRAVRGNILHMAMQPLIDRVVLLLTCNRSAGIDGQIRNRVTVGMLRNVTARHGRINRG